MRKKTLLAVLIILFAGIILYLPFLGEKEFQGEEGRRVLIALQMLENKEFLIPKLFDEPYFSKPPLFNWALAMVFLITKNCSEFVARAFSSFCLVLASLFLFFFWRKVLIKSQETYQTLSLEKILLPGLIFLTTPEVIDKAIRAEIDGFYTMLITVAIYGWFYFYEIKNKIKTAYIFSGIFLGLGILTKTFQALVFFYLTLLPYLTFKKRLKELLSIPHILGIFTYLGIFSLWAFLVSLESDFQTFFLAWIFEYFSSAKAQEMSFFQHLNAYTISAFLGFSPWIWFLLLYKDKNFISFLKNKPLLYNLALFSFFLFFFSYVFHFLFPGARLRYMLPSIGGLVFLGTLPIYYYSKENYLSKIYKTSLLKFLPLTNLLIAIIFLIYLSFSYKSNYKPNLVFYVFLVSFMGVNFYMLIRNFSSIRAIFYFLLVNIFLLKSLYITFYYPLHKEKINHFRNSAFKIANLVKKKNELYLCKTIPHHLIYYLKYKYKLIPHIYYLKDCSTLPEKSFILFKKEDLSETYFKKYKIYPLKIRTKEYFLVNS